MNEQRFRDLRFGLDEKFVFLRGLQVWKLIEAIYSDYGNAKTYFSCELKGIIV